MKLNTTVFIVIVLALCACAVKKEENQKQPAALVSGTWRLIKGILIEKNDTTVTDYTKNVSFIKVINGSHFAFLQHDLEKGKGTSPVYVSGGGSYSLKDSLYTEHLEICSDRAWEGNDFSFVVEVKNDTLVQRGIEKVENAGVDRINIEKYVKVK